MAEMQLDDELVWQYLAESREHLAARLQKVLGRDGYLLIGAMESLNGI